MSVFAELHCHSYFTFLEGAASPEQLVQRAAELGMPALALTDRDGLYGAVRFHAAAREAGIRPVLGAEITLAVTPPADLGPHRRADRDRVVLLALTPQGYRTLSRLLSKSRMSSPRGAPALPLTELLDHPTGLHLLTGGREGLLAALLHAGHADAAKDYAARFVEAWGDAISFEIQHHALEDEPRRHAHIAQLAQRFSAACVVTHDVRLAHARDKPLEDVLTAIRLKTDVRTAGRRLFPNAERRLHAPEAVRARFAHQPAWVERSLEIVAQVEDVFDHLAYALPHPPLHPGEAPDVALKRLTWAGAEQRYSRGISARVRAQIEHELELIGRLDLAGYFLIVHDIVRFCRERRILAQGRGSAANSTVCYCLGITAVDPIALELLFERFLSEARTEPPDIDLDIAAGRREEVIQYVYRRYGREHAALVCTVISYRRKLAVREVGKALGFPLEHVGPAAKGCGWRGSESLEEAIVEQELPLDLEDPGVQLWSQISERLMGFPRHLSIHPGGMVITHAPLGEVVPIEPAAMAERTVIQWDKDDCAAVGLCKIDLLGLGMLQLIEYAAELIDEHEGMRFDMARLPHDDPRVYDLLCDADTIGVFQVESRAQMNTLPRLAPRCFYDLVVEVALIRPGPIQGEMVHPYLRRRDGLEPIDYPHPSLEPALRRTLGVPLFQEQGMRVAIEAAGFTPAEADALRRAMGHKRSHEKMGRIRERLIDGMAQNGIAPELAERIFNQLAAFADYGFPESHAASFALIVYASAYLKVHHAPAFYAALLNAQPMGFYAPDTILRDARRHGVTPLPIDILRSAFDATCERTACGELAVRLGLRSVRSIGERAREVFESARAAAPFTGLPDVCKRSGLDARQLEQLAHAGAFRGLGLSRREAAWSVQCTLRTLGELGLSPHPETLPFLPGMSPMEETVADYVSMGLSIEHSPLELLTSQRMRGHTLTAHALTRARPGLRVATLGFVICRQAPPTAKGFVFLTLEDETGLINVVCRPQLYARYRRPLREALFLYVEGLLEREKKVTNLILLHAEEIHAGQR